MHVFRILVVEVATQYLLTSLLVAHPTAILTTEPILSCI